MILTHGAAEESFASVTWSCSVMFSRSSISADGAPSCYHWGVIASTCIASSTAVAAASVIVVVIASRRIWADGRHCRNQSGSRSCPCPGSRHWELQRTCVRHWNVKQYTTIQYESWSGIRKETKSRRRLFLNKFNRFKEWNAHPLPSSFFMAMGHT